MSVFSKVSSFFIGNKKSLIGNCDVCNANIFSGSGTKIPAATFRVLLERGFGIGTENLAMLTDSGITKEQAIQMLKQQYYAMESDWLLCSQCSDTSHQVLHQKNDSVCNTQDPHILYNKWSGGSVDFGNLPLPSYLASYEGIVPLPAMISQDVGTEITLVHIDRTSFVDELAKIKPYNLLLKSGLIMTSEGPVLFFLFTVPSPTNPKIPFTAMDCYVNPLDPKHLRPWQGLAKQSHWHYFLVDSNHDTVNFFEFENVYGLSETLQQAVDACKNMESGDFNLAKEELFNKYSIEDMLAM